ncbi:MAG TPA: methanol/ethanol family PQQ-dependent dehydrogenase [Paracoccus sp. (in: a-proteobacteria)]|nr:methanol/ethanol family PQQ-dependent dehydrogenase [Paracoccus sp. (in: a-proteobacteria)]
MKYILKGATAMLMLSGTAALANDSVTQAIANPAQWAIQTGDYANTRYSTLDQINRDNVKDLRVAWMFSTGVLRGHEGSPLVIGDIMYVHTPFPNNVFALDLNNDGRILWRYEPQQDPNVIAVMCCDTVNRGLAYAEGMVLLSQADTTVVALDAQTGQPKWSTKVGDPAIGETLTATVMPVKDKVMVGISGGEYGVRGRMTALNLADGQVAWKAYSTGPDEEMLVDPEKTTHLGKPIGKDSSLNSWEGDQWKIGGGPIWGWFSYDPELDLIYYGTGNPSTWNPSQRPGDNRWSMTIMARDPDDGMAKWLYQMTPHDEWDFDGVNEMILTDQDFDGQQRKLLTHFDRNGFGYTLDRETGELLVAKKFDPAVNWATEVVMDPNSDQYGRPQVVAQYSTEQNGEDTNSTGICPAALGSKDQQPAAFSPKTNLFYVPTNHVCMDYEPFRVAYTAGQPYVGATLSMYPAPNSHGGMGNFIAWDNVKGEIKWSNPEQFSVWSGALATAGDVVFYGTLEGYLKAIDAETGKELYRFKTPSGVIGNVMTYEHRGKQYVGILSGVGGWAGIGLAAGLTNPNEGLGAVGGYAALSDYTELGGQLTVFELPGEGDTAAAAPGVETAAAPADAAAAPVAAAPAAGATPSDPSAPAEGLGAGKSTATGAVPMEPEADAGTAPASN